MIGSPEDPVFQEALISFSSLGCVEFRASRRSIPAARPIIPCLCCREFTTEALVLQGLENAADATFISTTVLFPVFSCLTGKGQSSETGSHVNGSTTIPPSSCRR